MALKVQKVLDDADQDSLVDNLAKMDQQVEVEQRIAAVAQLLHTLPQFQLADEQSLHRLAAELLLASVRTQQQTLAGDAHLHEMQSVQIPLSLKPKVTLVQPLTNIRIIWRICKALLIAAVLWVCIMGQPMKFYEAFYQGLHFGWDSMCSDYRTCGGKPAKGILGDG